MVLSTRRRTLKSTGRYYLCAFWLIITCEIEPIGERGKANNVASDKIIPRPLADEDDKIPGGISPENVAAAAKAKSAAGMYFIECSH